MLEHLGIAVETVGDGREAVEAMRRGPDRFDAILMDMQMPEMDGLQATRVIRTEFPKHAVPIIAATASVGAADMTDCLDAGMNDYVAKPIEPRQLERVLSRWIALPSRSSQRPAGGAAGAGPAGLGAAAAPLKGVDVNAALVRLNGQQDLLVRLLRVFAQEHGQTTGDIGAAIARRDYDGALRLVHNLKGVAGTLSATAVFEAARELERGLREGHFPDVPALVDRLGEALDVVCGSVMAWTGAATTARPGEGRHEPDRPAAAALLAEFDALLKNRRFSARQRFDTLREHLTLPELAPAIDQVQRCLDRLDFQQARELLPSIASTLGVPFTRA
jgi:CheY-like chemotaxis protein